MDSEKAAKSATTKGAPVTEQSPDGAPEAIDPRTGMHGSYYVLSAEERAKGFVRPVRRSYAHVGRSSPKNPLRDLTPEEQERHRAWGYVKFEAYPASEYPVTGRFWTQRDLDVGAGGCGATTIMAPEIAETYARDPSYYGSTYCWGCKEHRLVGTQGEFVWSGTAERVGT
jgi:hypothetical protein